ncbi:DUF3105 domain-containing protein [Streptomyces sp. 5-10]|uniref:DUF3105 domain-containing protein n=1 Tax=Streptomyces sp. 5-10 TaxID=878925 RepID=UPI00168B1E00|nr:DUF3105 domain-containing protein [Streptomyces sp. 5-10]MBD3004517.1 DUF3105 domain-containing protein [Streptomyces sp. 5-10]
MRTDKHQIRRANSARLIAEEKRRTRKIRITVGSAVVIGIAALTGGGWALTSALQDKQRSHVIEGVKVWSDLSRNHTKKPVHYPMSPPVGGDHNPVWLKCMGTVYAKPVRDENAVHSLEHGAVWVTYTDKASETDVKALKKKVASTTYTMISPYKGQKSPITLTAWGHQLNVSRADDPRVDKFFKEYIQGKQTPEPMASCSGGYMRKAP